MGLGGRPSWCSQVPCVLWKKAADLYRAWMSLVILAYADMSFPNRVEKGAQLQPHERPGPKTPHVMTPLESHRWVLLAPLRSCFGPGGHVITRLLRMLGQAAEIHQILESRSERGPTPATSDLPRFTTGVTRGTI